MDAGHGTENQTTALRWSWFSSSIPASSERMLTTPRGRRCQVESVPWRTPEDRGDPDDARSTTRYLLACPNGCTAWPYQRRIKQIKNPWLYACPECDTTLLSCDIAGSATDLEPGRCHFVSVPWTEPRTVHACPNGCFSTGYGHTLNRPDSPSATGVRSVARERWPVLRMSDSTPSNREQTA